MRGELEPSKVVECYKRFDLSIQNMSYFLEKKKTRSPY